MTTERKDLKHKAPPETCERVEREALAEYAELERIGVGATRKKRDYSMRPGIVAATLLPAAVLAFGCNPAQPPLVKVQMTWACGFPEHLDSRSDYAKQDPAAKPVILYFSRYRNEFIQDNTPRLCDALTAAKHSEVPVLIQPFADSFGKYTGYRVVTIDGHMPGGGYGGGNGRIGNEPNPSLEQLLH
jgi:hypothetical protein